MHLFHPADKWPRNAGWVRERNEKSFTNCDAARPAARLARRGHFLTGRHQYGDGENSGDVTRCASWHRRANKSSATLARSRLPNCALWLFDLHRRLFNVFDNPWWQREKKILANRSMNIVHGVTHQSTADNHLSVRSVRRGRATLGANALPHCAGLLHSV